MQNLHKWVKWLHVISATNTAPLIADDQLLIKNSLIEKGCMVERMIAEVFGCSSEAGISSESHGR